MANTLTFHKCRILSGSMLKVLAILCMFIDHGAVILYPVLEILRSPFSILGRSVTLYWVLRKIGRLAFPIFCFLIAEGFHHTRNKKKYAIRLLIFAFISEVPFDLMRRGSFFDLSGQNVYFTLLLGLALIYAYESIDSQFKKFCVMALIAVAATILRTDYDLTGVLLVLVIYLFRNQPAVQALISYPLLAGGTAAFAAFVPINLYNDQRGFIKSPGLKFLFYLFYPAHILLLLGIRHLLR